MLVNEGIYVAERGSSCAGCFLDPFDAFYCFARLGDHWFLGHEFLGLFYRWRRRIPAKSQRTTERFAEYLPNLNNDSSLLIQQDKLFEAARPAG